MLVSLVTHFTFFTTHIFTESGPECRTEGFYPTVITVGVSPSDSRNRQQRAGTELTVRLHSRPVSQQLLHSRPIIEQLAVPQPVLLHVAQLQHRLR